MAGMAQGELQRLVSEDGMDSNILERVTVIGLGPVQDSKAVLYGHYESWYHGHQFLEAVIRAWPTIHPHYADKNSVTHYSNRQLRCATTFALHDFSRLPYPSVVINDMFAAPVADYLRTVEKTNNVRVQVYMWFSSDISRFLHHTGNTEHIGTGKWATNNIQETHKAGFKGLEQYQELSRRFSRPNGSIIRTPGLPDMYDYEFNPSGFPAPGILFESLMGTRRQALHLVDGCVVASSTEYQPVGVQACRSYFEGLGKQVYCVGPPVPRCQPLNLDSTLTQKEESMNFMDSALTRFGRNSVILISFGTCYFPSHRPEQFPALLRTLLNANETVPFVYSTASAMFTKGQLDPVLLDQLAMAQEKGLCYGSNWLPQRKILQHEAMGAFVSHCGYNSSGEANAYGIPMIAWPLVGDQPGNAAYQSSTLGVAWELLKNKDRPSLRLKGHHHTRSYLKYEGDVTVGSSTEWTAEKQEAFELELIQILLIESRPQSSIFQEKKRKATQLAQSMKHAMSSEGAAEKDVIKLQMVDEHQRPPMERRQTRDAEERDYFLRHHLSHDMLFRTTTPPAVRAT